MDYTLLKDLLDQPYYPTDELLPIYLPEAAMAVMAKKYLRGETPHQLFDRVALAIAQPLKAKVSEETYKKFYHVFYNMMASRDFMPNSPTLMNAGRAFNQLAACFVVPVRDSMEGIFREAIADMAMIQRTGGGTGFDFSDLRPKGASVSSTQGESSGPISFMRAFNACTDTVKQGGARRGANMGMLRVDHPDIREFITLKSDPAEMTNFNLSVSITDEFMRALEANEKYDLTHNGTIYGRESAREIWDLIGERAWTSGEPGVVFIDRINKYNTLPGLGPMKATNPCVVGDTLIKTVEGMIPIKDLVGQEIDVYCVDDKYNLTISKAKNIRMTQKQAQLVKVVTTKGTVTCTPEHKFYTRNRGYVEAQDLKIQDKMVALNVAPKNQKYVKVYLTGTSAQVQAEHVFLARHYYPDVTGKDTHHLDNDPKHNVFSNIEVLGHGDHSSLTNMGHRDWMSHDEATGMWIPNVVEPKDCSNALGVHPVGVNMKLLSVTHLEYTEDVYDMEVEEHHNFFANYVLIHNCGEQPLLDNEACNLGSINGRNCIKENGEIDYAKLFILGQLGAVFLDCVIDAGTYPLENITKQVLNNRKIGLGIMGFADVCFITEVNYGDAAGLGQQMMQAIHNGADDASERLAKVFGNFPNYEHSIFAKTGKMRRNATITTIAPTGTISIIAGAGYGIEPFFALDYTKTLEDTGEKLHFANEYVVAYMQKYDFPDELKLAVEDYIIKKGVAHGIYDALKGIAKNKSAYLQKLEEVFVTAHEISPSDHVHVQAAFQAVIDNAVSKTINFGNEVSMQEIQKIFRLAYQCGCKGITVYRDGCRSTQPMKISKEVQPEPEKMKNMVVKAMKRPMQLTGLTRQIQTGCGMMLVTANTDENGKIFEVLMRAGASGGCSAFTDATARLVSIALRHDVPISVLIDQLRSVRCDNFRYQSGKNQNLKGKSCPDVVGSFLQEMIDDNVAINITKGKETKPLAQGGLVSIETLNAILQQASLNINGTEGEKCPECGKILLRAEGCLSCVCGFSRC